MDEPQLKMEHGTGPKGPSDPAGMDNSSFAQELQELGLLEFAQEVDFNRLTEGPGGALPTSARHPSGSGPVGHNNPPPQPTAPLDIQQCQIANHQADMATARAIQVLHLAKVGLHQLVTSYNPRAAGSGATDGSSKRRKTSRGADASGSRGGSKGLRHFSMKVCEKVEAKGRTTYNEVADELVAEMSKVEAMNKNGQYDEKNIRRRVYDAINVLMAMDIIQKEKKEILWRGFPKLSHNQLDRAKAERLAKIKEVEQKQLYLQDMIEQQKALKKLLERSAARGPNPSGTQLFLPFILVQAKPDATVEVKISDDMMDVQFDFYHSPFQIHDDSHVLKKMAEHQARQQPPPQQPSQQQQQQQAPFGLPFMQAQNGGGAGNLIAAATAAAAAMNSHSGDPALAHLTVAAAQAQQGNALAYGYQALYHQQQQQQQMQQQLHQGGAAAQGQGQGGVQGHAAGQAQDGAQGLGAQGGPPHPQLAAQQLQSLQAQLQQLQQQQHLHAHLHLQRAAGGAQGGAMPDGLSLPSMLPPLASGHPSGGQGGAALSSQAGSGAPPSGSGQLTGQLSGQLSGSLPIPPSVMAPPAFGGLPSLPHAPPLSGGTLSMPPALAAALAPPPLSVSAHSGSAGGMPPPQSQPQSHGLSMSQLAAAPTPAYSLVA